MKKIIKNLSMFSLIIFVMISAGCGANNRDGRYDNFAQCLTDNGVKMYGAYWCPHCANQKELFGDSFDYVDYIECSLPNKGGQTEVCKQAGIKAYPTWEFQDDTRIEGELSLEQLSQKTNCKLSE